MAINRQDAELESLKQACQVESLEVVPKAQEMLRRMQVKCRPGALGKGELCRTLVALDLACRALDCHLPRKTCVKLSGVPEDVYASALGTAQRLVGLQRRYNCREVAKAVGGARVGTLATTELARYQERFLASYPAKQTASVDLNSSVYAVAVCYLCAKKLKHPVSKPQLLELALVSEAEFTGVCRSMLDLCYSTLGVSISDKPSAERLQQFDRNGLLSGSKHSDNTSTVNSGESKGRPMTVARHSHTAKVMSTSGAAAGDSSSTHGVKFPGKSRGNAFYASKASITRDLAPGSSRGSLGDGRTIPLTRLVNAGGTPQGHAAALARSIKAAAGKKRSRGAAVKLAEPGGNNDSNNSIYDRVSHPKRPNHIASSAIVFRNANTASNGNSKNVLRNSGCDRSNTSNTSTAASSPSPGARKPPPVAPSGATARADKPTSSAPGASRLDPVRNPYAIKATSTAVSGISSPTAATSNARVRRDSGKDESSLSLRSADADVPTLLGARSLSPRPVHNPYAMAASKGASGVAPTSATTAAAAAMATASAGVRHGSGTENDSSSFNVQEPALLSGRPEGKYSTCGGHGDERHLAGMESDGNRSKGDGRSDWKERALVAMEDRIKSSSNN